MNLSNPTLQHSPLRRRRAGVLLHPTSLPGAWPNGDLGREAYRFIDLLAAAGQTVWQLLPMGPTNGSPYQCFSAHAGNPALVSVELLKEWGWLSGEIVPGRDDKRKLIARAREGFRQRGDEGEFASFQKENSHWLDDFALYSVLKRSFQGHAWSEWPTPLRDRDPGSLAEANQRYAGELDLVRFEQFLFFRQWGALRTYARNRGIITFGDLPIFVAHDSADVWAQRHWFALDSQGHPTVVAGVPPDYFSEHGQRWGNPHYNWERMSADDFSWWKDRMKGQLKLFDLVRIDHFRGFEAYWEIPADQQTAVSGRWVKAPGDALFASLRKCFDPLPVVAEDLGIITDEVVALRQKYALPGMKVLHFAFDGGAKNPYLPHNHEVNSVGYTGTHDNDTTLGWYEGLNDGQRAYVREYLSNPSEPMPWPLIQAAYRSVAILAVVPFQDLLGLDGAHRMNTPGTNEGNWQWRFSWEMVDPGLAHRVHRLTEIYGRLP